MGAMLLRNPQGGPGHGHGADGWAQVGSSLHLRPRWGLRGGGALRVRGRGSASAGAGPAAHLPEHQLPVHVHGQVPKVQEHLVGGQLLLDDVVPVDGHDGHADEKVEVVRLGGVGGGVQIRSLTQRGGGPCLQAGAECGGAGEATRPRLSSVSPPARASARDRQHPQAAVTPKGTALALASHGSLGLSWDPFGCSLFGEHRTPFI